MKGEHPVRMLCELLKVSHDPTIGSDRLCYGTCALNSEI
jgi:hypothetical protein